MSAGTPPFASVLIANRGEIALRVVRTCRVMGIRSIAIYSEPDRTAPHVREADVAVALPHDDPRAAYLDVEGITAIAVEHGADAVHPGYGFLSESAAFPAALEAKGIVFVGPPADVLEGSSDKLIVKRLVADAGVPVIPARSTSSKTMRRRFARRPTRRASRSCSRPSPAAAARACVVSTARTS